MARELGVPLESLADYRPRYNIAPTDPHWIIRAQYEDHEILPAKWGLRQLLDERPEVRVQEHQRPRGDGAEVTGVPDGVQRAAMRRAGGWILRVDGAEGVADAGLVPQAGREPLSFAGLL